MNRRGFIKGLLGTVVVTPVVAKEMLSESDERVFFENIPPYDHSHLADMMFNVTPHGTPFANIARTKSPKHEWLMERL